MKLAGKAAADVVRFDNEAEAAGWKKAVEAFDGDGKGYAQYVMFQKLSSSYRRIMVNTADSPIMKIFESFSDDDPAAEASKSMPATEAVRNHASHSRQAPARVRPRNTTAISSSTD